MKNVAVIKKMFAVFFLASICLFAGTTTIQAQDNLVTPGTNVIVQTNTQPSAIQEITAKLQTSWPWYVTRASGLVASLVLFILMLSGIGFITGHTFTFLEPITAWATHRVLGIILGFMVLLHVGALYFDTFASFKLKDLLVPFSSTYKPVEIFGFYVGSLYVALGVLSLYIFAGIIFTSLFWIDKSPKVWKWIHLLSYVAVVLIFLHALFLGTDLAGGFMRWLFVVMGVLMLGSSVARLWRAKTV